MGNNIVEENPAQQSNAPSGPQGQGAGGGAVITITISTISGVDATDTFDTPVPITHSDPNPISAEGVAPHLARYKEIDLSDQSESRKQEIQDYIDWLESAPTVYAGIEQYKVSWPLPPRI